MRILFIGDVVGRTGREAVATSLPKLREALRIDLAVVNAENASHGFGLAPGHGDRAVRRRGRCDHAGQPRLGPQGDHPLHRRNPAADPRAEFSPRHAGRRVGGGGGSRAAAGRWCCRRWGGSSWTRSTARSAPPRDLLAKHRLGGTVAAILVDIHAEASSEKMAFGAFLRRPGVAVVGTHTHCPSADAQVLPGGTAFQSDAGMSGDYDSVIGMAKDGATLRFWRKMPGERLAPAEGEATVCGVFVETDDATGLARADRASAGGGTAVAGCADGLMPIPRSMSTLLPGRASGPSPRCAR